jgi:hypothetical protein
MDIKKDGWKNELEVFCLFILFLSELLKFD